jgi:tetratricopeptide (TPR) repeat protein
MKSNFKAILILIFMSVSALISAQEGIDYLKIRNSLVRTTCSAINEDTTELTYQNLMSIDSTKITNGLADYYYDLGMTYYEKAYFFEQKEFFPLVIASFENCILIDKKRSLAYWNLALHYSLNKQYELASAYLEKYKKYCKKKYWDKDQNELIEKSIEQK